VIYSQVSADCYTIMCSKLVLVKQRLLERQ